MFNNYADNFIEWFVMLTRIVFVIPLMIICILSSFIYLVAETINDATNLLIDYIMGK